jgi:DeoR family transcriptional regulator of aga operon
MATDRQARIVQCVAQNDQVDVGQLSRLLDVSPSTVRRELQQMEDEGMIMRVHGAARLPNPIRYEQPYESRASMHVRAKRAIAAAALGLIAPGASVGISGGTTCTELARQLRATGPLTIVTNAVNIAVELHGQPDKRLMVTGGILNQGSYELVGNLVAESLKDVHLDVAFLGCSGIDPQFGISMSDEAEAAMGRAFKGAADRVILLADHSKVGRRTFARFCRLPEVDLLITDDGLPADQRGELEAAGLHLLIAPVAPGIEDSRPNTTAE